MNSQAFIIWGVSGSGKSTIAQALAKHLDTAYYDADDFHSPQNIERMRSGIPLTDELRQPWLQKLHQHIQTQLDTGHSLTLACSCLKQAYRNTLAQTDPRIHFLYLRGTYELVHQRMTQRKGHYMPEKLLQSQFDTLEEPADGLTFDISKSPDALLKQILESIKSP